MKIDEITGAMKLGNLAKVQTNMSDADFWLRRSGSEKSVGEVLTEFNPDAIGIKVIRTEIIDPRYLRYVFMHLHSQGVFARASSGATGLVHIRAKDIADMRVGAS